MEQSICSNCQKPKAAFKCGVCESPICKKCAQFVESDHFHLMPKVPDELTRGQYCGPCFDEKISVAISEYDAIVEKAKKVLVFHDDDAAETRRFKRDQKPVHVENCTDNHEVLMRLAYVAVVAGCNTIVDVSTSSERVDLGGYQTSKWKGRGTPVKLDNYIPNRKSRILGKT